ncbi:hypothetical protein GC177_09345 [bacterium]|nr:hypothetical protein [bacterium]
MRYFVMIALGVLMLALGISMAAHDRSPLSVPHGMQQCNQDSDCDYADTSCSGCCEYRAIAKASAQDYELLHRKHCAGYQGGVCECVALGTPVFTCVNHRCKLSYKTSPPVH